MHDSVTTQSASPFAKLSPIVDKCVITVGVCLDKAPWEANIRHPAILTSDHHVTKLIVRLLHKREGHTGTNHTLTAVCQHYWVIIRGQALSSALSADAYHAAVDSTILTRKLWCHLRLLE